MLNKFMCLCGGMVDATDSKSVVRKDVPVQVRPEVPFSLCVRENEHIFRRCQAFEMIKTSILRILKVFEKSRRFSGSVAATNFSSAKNRIPKFWT